MYGFSVACYVCPTFGTEEWTTLVGKKASHGHSGGSACWPGIASPRGLMICGRIWPDRGGGVGCIMGMMVWLQRGRVAGFGKLGA